MKSAIFLTVAIVLGVDCLMSRVRRQFDWDNTEIDRGTPIRQNGPTRWGQGRPTNGGQGNPTGWGQNSQGFNPGIDGQDDNIFSDPNFGTNSGNQGNSAIGTNINQGSGNGVNSNTPAPTNTASPPGYLGCMKQCPRIHQYNPVCGSDNIMYWNIMELRCAVTCGRTVQLQREGRCAQRRTQINK